jgi:hypothetical protein
VVAALPSFDLRTDLRYGGKPRLNRIGAGQGITQPRRQAQIKQRQRFLKTLNQAGSRARVVLHQFVMQSVQRVARLHRFLHHEGRPHPELHRVTFRLRQMA